MSIGVSTEFIELLNGKWYVLPSNAINIVFEASGLSGESAEIITSHSGAVEHEITTLSSGQSGNKDHFSLDNVPGKFCLQMVKANHNFSNHVRVYFGRAK